eukprot:CAMPEP_0176500102 /NCGR_PEP_ID=MMETSP0200_2-20121128/13332_1 /TAXON_ID=947934 /ORGANISM="Chaetoceros sp., Strain GSL56" /LENGTH=1039 /DNA_ID=CAMNT_0017898667 /DNA_START=419 /DNA_END=3538 /DNA_ORIENTATION=-
MIKFGKQKGLKTANNATRQTSAKSISRNSSNAQFYSSSESGSSDSVVEPDLELENEDNSSGGGLNQLINGVKNTFNISRSKSNKSASEKSNKSNSDSYLLSNSSKATSNHISSSNGRKSRDRDRDYSSESDGESASDSSSESSFEGSESSDSASIDDDNDRGDEKANNKKVDDSAEDYSDDEDEGEDGYKPGGYHRVKIGEVYNQRYVVIKKLGWGHFSTVWMVKDKQLKKDPSKNSLPFYAIKVQKSAEHYTEAAMDEVELLDCIAKERKRVEASFQNDPNARDKHGIPLKMSVDHSRYVATLHDSFFHTGPNGKHMCMVFSMLGCNLLSVIKAYNYRGIPMPVVKRMVKGVAKGLDFLHRKCNIIHTDLKPENVLMQFPGQINTEGDQVGDNAATDENSHDQSVSIEELEVMLKNPKISIEERKKIRKKLKKRRQRDRRFNDNDDDTSEPDKSSVGNGTFSDDRIEHLLNQQGKKVARNAHERVLSRLSHSQFVMKNFSSRVFTDGSEVSSVINDLVKVSRPSKSELSAHFQICSSQIGNRSGVAEVSFILRAFVPEGEIADNVSASLSGIPWELSDEEDATREWRCGLSVQQTSDQSVATMFKLVQHGRKDLDDGLRKTWNHLSDLVSENLAGREMSIPTLSSSSRSYGSDAQVRSTPFSLFTVKFSVLSSMIVLGFLEDRIPGLVFMNYKREEASPPIDHVIFGPFANRICKHPLAMKIKDSVFGGNDPSSLGSALFGYDLRMIKEFSARPTVDEDGGSSFQLIGTSMEKVASWWQARQPIHDRVKAFMGLSPNSELTDMPLFSSVSKPLQGHQSFIEGGKISTDDRSSSATPKAIDPLELPMSETHAAVSRALKQPDLKDVNVLLASRAVVVDLGNACWTDRHFSEDIQTRQYRAPEVLLGHKYDTSADIWSLGCMTFELLTGDLLFDPREGPDYDRDEDHLAMFQELLGKIPKKMACTGKYSKNYFDRKGNLKHIKQLKFWPIQDVLHEKYHFSIKEANEVAEFMLPLLEYDTKQRATALQCLRHKWLKDTEL